MLGHVRPHHISVRCHYSVCDRVGREEVITPYLERDCASNEQRTVERTRNPGGLNTNNNNYNVFYRTLVLQNVQSTFKTKEDKK